MKQRDPWASGAFRCHRGANFDEVMGIAALSSMPRLRRDKRAMAVRRFFARRFADRPQSQRVS